MSSVWIPTSSFQWGTYQVFYAYPRCYSQVTRTDQVHLMSYWGIFPSFSHGGHRSLTYLLQFPSLSQDIWYSPHWPLFLSSSSRWALSGASFETCRVPFSYFQWIEICSSMPHWGIPPSFSSLDLLRTLSLLDLFFDLYESSYWGIPPLMLFYWDIPPSLGLPRLVLISWLSDPFVDLYELSPRASPYYRLV